MLEKGDVIGPFESSELKKMPGFSLETLVCPETLGDNAFHWKPASFYFDFGGNEKVEIKSGLAGGQTGKLTVNDKISIEEYFTNVYQNEHSELSDILGIPDDLENSDMYLGRFLQRELRPETKTKNTKIRKIERELEKERRKYDRTFGPQGKILSREVSPLPVKEKPDFIENFKIIPRRVTAPPPAKEPVAAPAEAKQPEPAPASLPNAFAIDKAETLRLKEDDGVKQAAGAIKQDSPEDIFVREIPPQTHVEEPLKTVNPETDHNLTFSVKRTKLKAQNIAAPEEEKKPQSKKTVAALTALCILIFFSSIVFIFIKYQRQTPAPVIEQQEQFAKTSEPEPPAPAPEVESAAVPVPAPAPVILPPPPSNDRTKTDEAAGRAVEIARNHFLKNKNATIENFLNTYFEQYRRQGYAAVWSVEHLHNDVYIVKYRLTKTRQEPIVYIFEVNTNKGIVSGALNNLTLDLLDM
ncbi:hypothetical protein FACS189437_00830 [Bacteroidia bacterium]|nr:hypothetical protein FACS189437_00830 [Bacteroidia bacterium]